MAICIQSGTIRRPRLTPWKPRTRIIQHLRWMMETDDGNGTTNPTITAQETNFTILPVRTVPDLEATKTLFTAYVEWLDLDLSFQDFETEMASMPGKYAPPTGDLLIARDTLTDTPLGCVAVRPLPSAGGLVVCEMKRLYVSPLGRGRGVGKQLVKKVIETAKRLGYSEIRLDTLPRMEAARSLYASFGFREIEPYYDTPLEGTIFLALRLD